MIKKYDLITDDERIVSSFEIEEIDEDTCEAEANDYLNRFIEGLRIEEV